MLLIRTNNLKLANSTKPVHINHKISSDSDFTWWVLHGLDADAFDQAEAEAVLMSVHGVVTVLEC